MNFAEVVIREVQSNRSFKIFKLFAERIGQTGQSSAVHTQCVVLLFNVRRGDLSHVGHSDHNRFFHFDHFGGRIPTSCFFIEADDSVGFYELSVINLRAKSAFNGVPLSPREKEILSYLVAGCPNKAIARCMGITEATVKVHLKSVQRKIRVENRTQAAIWALAYLPELDTTPHGLT